MIYICKSGIKEHRQTLDPERQVTNLGSAFWLRELGEVT